MKRDVPLKGKILQWIEEHFNVEVHKVMPKAFERKGVNVILKDKKDLVGLEIGVYKGRHAKYMCELLDIKELHLIDPYGMHKFRGYNESMKKIKQKAVNNLRKYPVSWIFSKSEYVHLDFDDNFFDFIYLDGDHTYETVSKELELYWPKVKQGGVFGGHDFQLCTINSQKNGVLPAVVKFIQKHNLKLYHYQTDWWVVKEREE
jgi:hypothetical protein